MPIVTPIVDPFFTPEEVSMIRGAVYKYCHVERREEKKRVTYVARTGSRRRVCNEAELIATVRRFDVAFERVTFDAASFERQVEVMFATDVLCSIHGAQLVNIVFLRPRSAVIELFNPFFFAPFYGNVARKAGLRYYAVNDTVVVNDVGRKERETWWQPYLNSNINVKPDVLFSLLQEVLCSV